MKQLTLTHGNEVLTIHKNGNSYFATFGAVYKGKENFYEMNLTKEDLDKLREFIK